jgi:hypothetical protein
MARIKDLSMQSRKVAKAQGMSSLCGANPKNSSFSAIFPERRSPMTNDKLSMTISQFSYSTLVAACRAKPWRLRAFALNPQSGLRG